VKVSASADESVFPYSKWYAQIDSLRAQYQKNDPFPHIAVDQFLNQEILDRALIEFPSPKSDDWIHYVHFNERKLGKNKLSTFPPVLKRIVESLNSDDFVKFLADLTGFQGLQADPMLEGGGLHQSSRNGFLNIHADFTSHPHHRNWRRRVNVLIYLNKDWKDEYGGHLELWDRKMTHCVQKIAPMFNRCVIFNTDSDAFHGHPNPLQCPETMTRKSIALYYFTKEKAPLTRATNYQPRPGDGVKGVGIYLDKVLLAAYDRFKRITRINDDFVSNCLKSFDRWKKKG
jgi:hypothetical protein